MIVNRHRNVTHTYLLLAEYAPMFERSRLAGLSSLPRDGGRLSRVIG